MTHTLSLSPRHTHTYHCVTDTLVIVTDTHQHIDRGLYTYMTSYLAQVTDYQSIVDKPTLASINY